MNDPLYLTLYNCQRQPSSASQALKTTNTFLRYQITMSATMTEALQKLLFVLLLTVIIPTPASKYLSFVVLIIMFRMGDVSKEICKEHHKEQDGDDVAAVDAGVAAGAVAVPVAAGVADYVAADVAAGVADYEAAEGKGDDMPAPTEDTKDTKDTDDTKDTKDTKGSNAPVTVKPTYEEVARRGEAAAVAAAKANMWRVFVSPDGVIRAEYR